MRVSALYVDSRGPYPKLGLDCWDLKRDARNYTGPNPVVAHPPCGSWSKFAKINQKRWGVMVGDDSGCFLFAYLNLLKFGGVLEHPKHSIAWDHFSLRTPVRGKWLEDDLGWVTEVSQSAYGCKARKQTWLFATGKRPLDLDWSDPRGTHQVGYFDRVKPVLSKREASETPIEFAKILIKIASDR